MIVRGSVKIPTNVDIDKIQDIIKTRGGREWSIKNGWAE